MNDPEELVINDPGLFVHRDNITRTTRNTMRKDEKDEKRCLNVISPKFCVAVDEQLQTCRM